MTGPDVLTWRPVWFPPPAGGGVSRCGGTAARPFIGPGRSSRGGFPHYSPNTVHVV